MIPVSTTRTGRYTRSPPEARSRMPAVHLNGQDYFVGAGSASVFGTGQQKRPPSRRGALGCARTRGLRRILSVGRLPTGPARNNADQSVRDPRRGR